MNIETLCCLLKIKALIKHDGYYTQSGYQALIHTSYAMCPRAILFDSVLRKQIRKAVPIGMPCWLCQMH